jgi:hypothetical protein
MDAVSVLSRLLAVNTTTVDVRRMSQGEDVTRLSRLMLPGARMLVFDGVYFSECLSSHRHDITSLYSDLITRVKKRTK